MGASEVSPHFAKHGLDLELPVCDPLFDLQTATNKQPSLSGFKVQVHVGPPGMHQS